MARVLAVVLSFGILLGLAGFAEQEDVVRIGVAVSMTGRFAVEGTMMKSGIELWAQQVNQLGGITIGEKPYRVEVIFYDDKSDASTAAKLTEKLIVEDKVHFLIAPYSSALTFATSTIGEKYGVISIAPAANAPGIYERGYRYVFSILPPAPVIMHPVLELAASLEPEAKVAILVVNDLFPLFVAEGAKKKAEELGLKVVLYEVYPVGTTDFSSLLAKVKASAADILLVCGYVGDALITVRQSKDLDVNPKMVAFSVGIAFPPFLELGRDADYFVEPEWWWSTLDLKGGVFETTSQFRNMYKEKFGVDPAYQAASGAAAGDVLKLAIEKANSLDTEKVREALLSLDVELAVFPRIRFDETGQNVAVGHVVVQIQNGEYVVVWPPHLAQAPVVYPMPPWSER